MAGVIEEHGVAVTLDLGPSTASGLDPHVRFSPSVDTTGGLFLVGFYAENCSFPALKLAFHSSELEAHRTHMGVAVIRGDTGALVNNPATGAPYIQAVQGYGATAVSNDIPALGGSHVIFPGLVAQQGVLVEFQIPKAISHKGGRGVDRAELRIRGLQGQDAGLSWDRLILEFRAFRDSPTYHGPYSNRNVRDAVHAGAGF